MIEITDQFWIYIALIALPFALAMVRGGIKIHSPLFLFFLTLLSGVFLKGGALALLGNDVSFLGRSDRILLMQDVSTMLPGFQAALVSVICFFLGYLLIAPSVSLSRASAVPAIVKYPLKLTVEPIIQRRMVLYACLILVAAMALMVLYFIVAGENPFTGQLSAKRFLRTEIGSKFQSPEYYIFKLATFAKLSCYLAFLVVLFGKRTLFTITLLAVSVSFFLAMMVYFNIRSHAFVLIVDFVVLASIAGIRFFNVRGLLIALSGGALLLLMTALRRLGNAIRDERIIDHWEAFQDVAVSLLQGRHFMDITKIAHVMNAVPEQIPYALGQTLYSWIFIPLPVSVGMTYLEMGPLMAVEVFNEPQHGVTLGFTAELYFNFGWAGIVVGTFLLGFFLRQARRIPSDSTITGAYLTLIYAMIVVRMTILMFNSSFGAGIMALIIDLIPVFVLWPFLFYSWRHEPSRSPAM